MAYTQPNRTPRPVLPALAAATLVTLVILMSPAVAQNVLPSAPPEVSFTVTRFQITGLNPLGETRAQEVLRPFLGPQTGLDKLQGATAALEKALQEEGYGLYRAVLPPQETVDMITIRIEPIRIAETRVSGSRFHGDANIRNSVPSLKDNFSPNMRDIARELVIANDNGSKNLTLRLSESDIASGVDAKLEVTDSKPWNAIFNLNNMGTRDTGRSRLVSVLQHHNVFDRDHTASFAFTTSPEKFEDVRQYGMFYKIPSYLLGGIFQASYSYSTVNSGALGSGQEITGRGTTRGLSYTHYFHPAGAYRSTLAVGLDDKLFRAPVVGGIVLPTGDVRSRPASLEYAGRYDNDALSMNGAISYARNIAGGRNNDTASYAANRFGADEQWEVMRTQLTMITRLKGGWMINATARGQFTREPLLAGEQFGVGGVASVRGFDERSVSGDRGLSLSFEFWTPELAKDLRLLAFLDSAKLSRIQAVAGTGASESIMSVGVGLRYGLSRTGSVSLDFGVVTQGSSLPVVNRGASVLHGSLLLQF